MGHLQKNYFSFSSSRSHFLNGVCAAAILSGSTLSLTGAEAGERIIDAVNVGKDGAAWHWVYGPNNTRTPVDPQPGEQAAGVTVVNEAIGVHSGATSTAIAIGAKGGTGALGSSYRLGGLGSQVYYLPGQNGGGAGDVSAILAGDVSGAGTQASGGAGLLSVSSLGGDGRVGYNGQIGKGGDAGKVSLEAQGRFTTTGGSFSAIWARSVGGQTGRNETYRDYGGYSGSDGYMQAGVDAAFARQFPGARGGDVSLLITGTDTLVSTAGGAAPAVIAESVGGAGIDGATVRRILPGAGAAGDVTFINQGHIITSGLNSAGVILQSVGGRGGTQLFGASDDSATVGASGGGRGGDGGTAGTVTATQSGTIQTLKDYSFGLAAYSIGGLGGDGALGYRRDGGSGGNAGNGSTVHVLNEGTIETQGAGSIALLAQSLGAGSASRAFQAADIVPGSAPAAGKGGGSVGLIWADKGGKGGNGGNGGTVEVLNIGTIATRGAGAFGILAQSIGGGGGKGGDSSNVFGWQLGMAAGGDGGGGGNGGTVMVGASAAPPGQASPIEGMISTLGDRASAIVAQSIGGGGGAGGTASSRSAGVIGSASFAVGGSGGAGGNGGDAGVVNTSQIVTSGVEAHGVEVKSIGGGGGKGGSASSYSLAAASSDLPSVSLAFSVGGSGGDGGNGGHAEITNLAPVKTSGERAYGLFAQSVGGGGGSGASASALADVAGLGPNLAVSIALGGSGGGGGAGGSDTWSNSLKTAVRTNADGSVQLDASGKPIPLIAHVEVYNSATVRTSGALATGIFAQSVGGGGGDGGTASAKTGKGMSLESSQWFLTDISSLANNAIPVGDTIAISAAVGGSGGAGGAGKKVVVENFGEVLTSGIGARGIFAQSVGGGGGTAAGFVSKPSGELSLSIGGLKPSGKATGGAGGNGGVVAVTHKSGALITTKGDDSAGIFAQSVGGGGGVGGSLAGNPSSTSRIDTRSAGAVVDLVNNIQALNKRASKEYQILAKHFTGEADANNHPLLGKKSTVQQALSSAEKYIAAVNGAYKALKNSKTVDGETVVTAIGAGLKDLALSVATKELKDAIEGYLKDVKQDPFKTVPMKLSASLAIGGQGGKGGDGGDVYVINEGEIRTSGKLSFGVFAQSVGGGGGVGGGAEVSAKNWYNVAGTIGGSGGNGGKGGAVSVSNSYRITTAEAGAFGILAQSVGGGGGIGGGAANNSAVNAVVMTYKLGGTGDGKRNTGDAIKVTNSGTITTGGKEAHGIVAQSVGGGGGIYVVARDAPISDSTLEVLKGLDALYRSMGVTSLSGLVSDLTDASLKTRMIATIGGQTFVDSGSPPYARRSGGNGSAVTVNHSGAISTTGLGALGIFAQSIGGGGGFGVDASSSTALVERELVLGGNVLVTGDGGDVDVHFGKDARITTSGDGASAVFLQSIGGGGGYGGAGTGSVTMSKLVGPYPSSYWWGRTDGYIASSGKGGAITVDMGGANGLAIRTSGIQAHGIFAQSLSGGGGYAFDPGKSMPLTDTSDNNAIFRPQHLYGAWIATRDAYNVRNGDVKISTTGDIIASGVGSYGIFVQNGRQGTTGAITYIPNSLISYPNDYNLRYLDKDTGKYVYYDWNEQGTQVVRTDKAVDQVLGEKFYSSWSGRNTIAHAGVIYGGSGTGAAIRVDGGDTTITLAEGSMVSAASGNAILTSFGEDRLTNGGTLIGNVNLATGRTVESNLFTNTATGMYRSVPGAGSIGLGSGGHFVNAGVLDIGGVGRMGTLNVSGGTTTLSGTLLVDIDALTPAGTQKADLLKAEKLILDGVTITPKVGNGLTPGHYLIAQSGNAPSIEVRAPATVTFNPEGPISWKLLPGGSQVQLRPDARFRAAASGIELSRTEQSMIGRLQEVWDSGKVTTQAAQVFGILSSVASKAEYIDAIDSLSPEGQQQPATAQTINARNAITQALSCPIFVSASTTIGESQCAWARITGSRLTLGESAGSPGFTQTGVGYRAGAQWEIAPDWFLGATAGYLSTSSSSGDGYTRSTGSGGDISVALKRQLGLWYFAAAANIGYGTYKLNRSFDVGDESWLAETNSDVWTGALRTRAAYEFPFQNWYARPYVDVDLIHTYMPGYTLQGDGASLTSSAMNQWTLALQPAMELGARINLGSDAWLRPFASLGLTYLAGQGLSTKVAFGDGSGNSLSFTSTAEMPDLLLDIGAGLQIFANDTYELRGEYKAQIADHFLSQEAMIRASFNF